MKVALNKIVPNPFRDLELNPLNPEVIDDLKLSIESTDFWDNLLARRHPTRKGVFELAYGHHRVQALRELYTATTQIELTVRKLSDEAMLRIMANENEITRASGVHTGGNTNVATYEVIRAALKAYADGKIEMPPIDPKTNKQHIYEAPSLIDAPVGEPEHPYTVLSLAQLLEWTTAGSKNHEEPKAKLVRAFKVMQAEERSVITQSQALALPNEQSIAVAEAAQTEYEVARADGATKRQAVKQAREFADDVIATILSASSGRFVAKDIIQRERRRRLPAEKQMRAHEVDINRFARHLQDSIDTFFKQERRHDKLKELEKHIDYLEGDRRHWLCQSLRAMAREATKYADKFTAKPKAVSGSEK